MGRGSLGHSATPRFPSPLLKPDVRISRIRLSDRFHREGHDIVPVTRGACAAGSSIFASRHSSFGQVRQLQVFAGQRPITLTSPSSRAHQKSGPFPPPALPGFIGHTTLSDSRWQRHPSRLPSCQTGLPRLPASPLPACRAHYPGGSHGCARRLLPRPCCLPRFAGGSASASLLSRPAQASLALRPVGLLNRQKRPWSRGSSPSGCPSRPFVSY